MNVSDVIVWLPLSSIANTSNPTDYWFLHSHDGGVTWSETQVTPASFDGELAPVARGLFLGDYMGLTVRSGGFMAALTQTSATVPQASSYDDLIP